MTPADVLTALVAARVRPRRRTNAKADAPTGFTRTALARLRATRLGHDQETMMEREEANETTEQCESGATEALAALVLAVAGALIRDPRVHPRKGDVVDDDPPLVPLTVVAVWPSEDEPRIVVAERRATWMGFDVVKGRWRGTLGQWRREMR